MINNTKPDPASSGAEGLDLPVRSYGSILKSTTVIGGASVLTNLFNMVRGKFAAVLLQPDGVGLMGMYNAITATVATAASIGLSNSGVRQIAEAEGTHDERQIAGVVVTLHRLCLILGAAGALLMTLLAWPISQWSFGNGQHTRDLMILAPVVFCAVVSGGQGALLQGMRRVEDVARMNVIGAIIGTVCGIPIMFMLLQSGIVPMLVVVAFTGVGASWWYARQVRIPKVAVPWDETWRVARQLLHLGMAFMVSALLTTLVAWLTRLIVWRQLGDAEAGQYQAAWTLSGLYVGYVLQAMGTDYYPRLTAVATDHNAANRMINEQTEVALLLAVPGILATLTLAPLILHVFYSAEFFPGVELLRWQLLGVLLRVASWPMGFIMLAKGNRRLFLVSEVTSNLLQIAFVWYGCSWFGLRGVGIAYLAMYAVVIIMVYWFARRLTGFRFSAINVRLLAGSLATTMLVFLVNLSGNPRWSLLLCGMITVVAGAACLHLLVRLLPDSRWSRLAHRVMPWLKSSQ